MKTKTFVIIILVTLLMSVILSGIVLINKTTNPTLQEVVRYEVEHHSMYKNIYGGDYNVDTVLITSHYAIARMVEQDTFWIAFDITTERRYSIVHFCKCDFNWRGNDIYGCDGCEHTIISGIEFLYYRKEN